MAETADLIVVGAGMAGAAAAAHLAVSRRVVLLERESQPGYHSTGRSAALFTETYGNRAIRALTGAGRESGDRCRGAALHRDAGGWIAATRAGEFAAPVVINAAGAWADVLAGFAGLPPIGLVPERRTALTIAPPAGLDTAAWPMTLDIEENFYFKPDAGRLLVSPADETPMPPCDVQPDELDVAIAIDRLTRTTTIEVSQIERKWAGLRSFVSDKTTVCGFDPLAPGFFWLAGQGGYGIQTADGMARCAASLIDGGDLPADIAAKGVGASVLSPARFR